MPRTTKPKSAAQIADIAEKDAITRLREVAFHPSLDEVWAKHPSLHTPEEREALVQSLRQERALWHAETERRARRKRERGQPAGSAPVADDSEVWEE